MSNWSYINGIITVVPLGNTQAEKRYILDTVLAHLPKVTGDEKDMCIEVIQEQGHNMSSSTDEFEQRSNLGSGYFGYFQTQDKYKLVIYGHLRGRTIDQAYKELLNWLCRLAKRIQVWDVLINLNDGWEESRTICYEYISANPFSLMFEDPSWVSHGKSVNWCEYLMPIPNKQKNRRTPNYPAMLAYKYHTDEDNDQFVESVFEIERKK